MNLEVEQMDVKTTFLHSDLEEEIYMEKGKEHLVCRLKKSLYGLKQAPRRWYRKFESFMTDQAYHKTQTNHCMFVKKFEGGDFLILLLYVDDMLIVGRDRSKKQLWLSQERYVTKVLQRCRSVFRTVREKHKIIYPILDTHK